MYALYNKPKEQFILNSNTNNHKFNTIEEAKEEALEQGIPVTHYIIVPIIDAQQLKEQLDEATTRIDAVINQIMDGDDIIKPQSGD